jgi:probable phosphoglycerate mutase
MSQKVDIIVFRHGETDWNLERRIQGSTDVPLNKKGSEQAKELAAKLKNQNLKIIYSSDLLRAKSTAEIISEELKIQIEYTPKLREIHCGTAEGRINTEVWRELGEEFKQRWHSYLGADWDLKFPQGESKRAAIHRVTQFILEVARKHPNLRIGVCSHGGILEALMYVCVALPKIKISLNNCVAYHFVLELDSEKWFFINKIEA